MAGTAAAVPRHARSLLLTGPSQLRWVEEELPPLGAEDLLVETRAGAISIGSELPRYRGVARASRPPCYPAMTGYESLGTVIARGGAALAIPIGGRVVGFYGHRTHAVVPQGKVIAVPAGITDELALLAILTCDVAKGIRKIAPRPHERVLVTGGGAIGLLTVWTLAALGAGAVDLIEPLPARLLCCTVQY